VELDLPGWECKGCAHVRENAGVDVAEVEACLLLLWAAFKPGLYQAVVDRQRRSLRQNQVSNGQSTI
jgi:hypothetical protein